MSYMSAEKLLLFLVMLSVLVVLHEYGHFLLARRNGVRVNDFALGMGPTLLKWTSKRSGTNYRLNLLPIGGYCAMQGEDGKTNEGEQRREFLAAGDHATDDNFQAKSPLQRLSIVVAGPIANFIVAIVLLFVSASVFGVADANPTTKVYQLTPGFPAQQAGLRPGDDIVAIDGVPMRDGNQLVHTIYAKLSRRILVTYERDGHDVTVPITTRTVPGPDGKPQGRLGFSPMPAMRHASLAESAQFTWLQFSGIVGGTFNVLGHLVTNFASTASQIQGPIGIAQVSSQVADFGAGAYLSLAAALSISLGIFNLLPIPALDGGRGIFILVEMVRGKPVDPGKEALVHVGGFAALMVVMLAVAYHDIVRIVAGKAAF
jgi:regulator of sigma E protease